MKRKKNRPPGSREQKKGLMPSRKHTPTVPPPGVTPQAAELPAPNESPKSPEMAPGSIPFRVEDNVDQFPVVGIGASAGGMEAFLELLHALPSDTGMGFVFLMHLSPTYKSVLAELLARATSLPVVEITDAMPVERNHVYVLPPNWRLTIDHGILHLSPRQEVEVPRLKVIDLFFHSLAADLSDRAIGVVLSGTATDGTLGLAAIKKQGGITFAQDERTAKYDGMPSSAIATGFVDFVLRPKEIARELTQIVHHPYLKDGHLAKSVETPVEADEAFQRILFLLQNMTGTDFTLYKESTIRRRILRRMLLHRIDNHGEYAKLLIARPQEVKNLFDDILIHVTSFFRDPAVFEALRETAFPVLFENRTMQAPVRVWVPGCSSGEEVYSIAIAMLEYMGGTSRQVPIQIFGTDLSELMLQNARSGRYPETIRADVSPERLQRFFMKVGGGYQILKSIRNACIFAKQNITRDPPFSKIDLISCRNVLIYFGKALHKKMLPRFHYALNPTGFLVLGSSETITGFTDLFSPAGENSRLYIKKTLSHPHSLKQDITTVHTMKEFTTTEKTMAPKEWNAFDLQKAVDRTLLTKYAPVGVVVNEDLEIVQFRGKTGLFLEPASGAASLSILKMVREGLLFSLQSALLKARERQKPVRREGLVVKEKARTYSVNIEVIPLQGKEVKERFYLVVFEDAPASGAPSPVKRGRGGKTALGRAPEREAVRVKQELAAAKEYLQSIIQEREATNEELQSASEEIQSSNEELQSTNEELETAKEELQSANEELNTVNEALEERNGELHQVNNDLVNLINSVHVSILIVGSDLRIRRYTPSAERILNIIATDVGRKITDIKLNVIVPDLEQLIAGVIDNLHVEEREVQDTSGRWYAMRLRPYRTLDNKIEGVVLVFFDITDLKRLDEQRRLLNELGESLMEIVGDPVLVIDRSWTITKANTAFARRFNVPWRDVEGKTLSELHDGAWRSAEVQEFLGRALQGKDHAGNCIVRVDIPGAGPSAWALMTRPITRTDGKPDMLLIVLKDQKEPDSPEGGSDKREERVTPEADARGSSSK